VQQGLPRHKERFRDFLNTNLTESIGGLEAMLDAEVKSHRELGRAMEEQTTALKRACAVRKMRTTKARRALTQLGFTPRAGEGFTDDQVKGIETLNKLFSGGGQP